MMATDSGDLRIGPRGEQRRGIACQPYIDILSEGAQPL